MAALPSGLVPTIQGYSLGGPDGAMRTPVSGGLPRYALEFDRGVQQFKVTFVLDPAQFAVWTLFFLHTTKKGTISFDMPLDSGFGTQTHTVNILPGSYGATRTDGTITVVSFAVEAESTAYDWTDDDATSLLALWELYGESSSDLLGAIARFATVDSNVL